LFAAASPTSWHQKVIKQAVVGNHATHLLIVSRNAHPALQFAGIEMGLTTITYVEGQTSHGLKHADNIMKTMCVHKVLPNIKKALQEDKKADFINCHSVEFIVAESPDLDKQIIQLRDVDESSESTWRAGINKIPADLEKRVAELTLKDSTQLVPPPLSFKYGCALRAFVFVAGGGLPLIILVYLLRRDSPRGGIAPVQDLLRRDSPRSWEHSPGCRLGNGVVVIVERRRSILFPY
jgi:hypothetical protein